MTFDRNRPYRPCRWRGCPVTIAIMDGDYCITHWYKANGKQLPDNTPAKPRPAVDSNKVFMGRQATSRAAAQNALPSSGTKRRQVYDLIMSNMSNGLTADEIQITTGISPNTINPTIKGLADDGWIYDSGERRATRTGNMAIVWVAV